MSETRIAVSVRIAGEEHVIRSSADPEHTMRCARLVDERIKEIRARAGGLEGQRVAILAALSLADELFQLRDRQASEQANLDERAQGLVERIEAALGRAGEAPAGEGPIPPG